jgi:nucleoside-diphosphate-sugar epimerase
LTPSALLHLGRVTVIGSRPLLEALADAPAGGRRLILYGTAQTTYHAEHSEVPYNPESWLLWRSITLSNLFEPLDATLSTNAPRSFYRARE